jgi:6,7-dimethyl-8-ribityllumazine synthase
LAYQFCFAEFINREMTANKFRNAKFILLASRFNESITQALVAGARTTLERHGVPRTSIHTLWVPGAFELPGAAARVAASLRPDAIVALGCLIKGETPQYAAIGHAVAHGLTQVSVSARIPVTLGVIIAASSAQARERSGGRMGNRGSEAALAALAMADFQRQLSAK